MAPTPMMRLKVSVRIGPRCYHPLLAAPLLLLTSAASAADPVGEAWVALPPEGIDPALVRTSGQRVGEHGRLEVRVLATPERLAGLEVRGWTPDHRRGPPPQGYHHPDDAAELLDLLARGSDRAGRARLGTSVEGRPIEALWLGRPPGDGAATYRIVGAHHGDEPSSAEVVLALAEALVEGDGADEGITSLLDRATVWLVPYVNPDGVIAGSRFDVNGVDLNRNHDFGWSPAADAAGPAPWSEPETRALRALGELDRLTLGIAVHAGATNLGWPWNFTTEDPADRATFEYVAATYATSCGTDGFWLTQGADWYVSTGDQNDWLYGRWGELDLTLEVAHHDPDAAELPRIVGEHLDALLAVLAPSPEFSGVVRDAVSGLPVEANLAIVGRTAPFWSDAATGAFHRLAAPEPGVLTVSAWGYAPVEVPIAPGVPAEVALEPLALLSGRVEPPVLRGRGVVRLPDASQGPLTLLRPGADPVTVVAAGDEVVLDPALLAPGFWSIQRADGGVWPRALWVDGAEPGVRISGWTVEDDVACALGEGFAHGARAWAAWGRERVPVELPPVEQRPDRLCFSVAAVPEDTDPDVGIWTNGARLGLDHLFDPRTIEGIEDERLIAVGACAHGPFPGHHGASALSLLLTGGAAWRARRRRR